MEAFNMLIADYVRILKKEFSGYNGKKFGKDALAGITVAAVALPLALAFGVSSGATAASGLVTAIISGLIIGVLSGASYQISGPTGAMTAILVSLVAQYGMQGVFVASLMAGVILLLCGIFKLGGLVSYLPSPVITGFTSGIAIIIALGQIDNLTGMKSSGLTNLAKIASYFNTPQTVNFTSLIIGLCVIVFMFVYPKKLGQYCPGSLAAIIIATAANLIFKFDVNTVGAIPKTIFLDDRLSFAEFDMSNISHLIVPAVSIAALGLIESLLCGASAGRMKNEKLNADVELVAQGIGNILLPFFGGVSSNSGYRTYKRRYQERRRNKAHFRYPRNRASAFNVRSRRCNVKHSSFGSCRRSYRNCMENERVENHQVHFQQEAQNSNVPVSYHNGCDRCFRPYKGYPYRRCFLPYYVRCKGFGYAGNCCRC